MIDPADNITPQNLRIGIPLDIFCDGGARGNPGPGAVGFVVKDRQGRIIAEHAQSVGTTTNNTAEYLAVIHALEWLQNRRRAKAELSSAIRLFLDSRLVVNQLLGRFKVKDRNLRQLIEKVRSLENAIGKATTHSPAAGSLQQTSISYHLIPREANSAADALVNLALDRHSHPR